MGKVYICVHADVNFLMEEAGAAEELATALHDLFNETRGENSGVFIGPLNSNLFIDECEQCETDDRYFPIEEDLTINENRSLTLVNTGYTIGLLNGAKNKSIFKIFLDKKIFDIIMKSGDFVCSGGILQPNTEGKTLMSHSSRAISVNKDAAIQAAQIVLGKTVLDKVTKEITKMLPRAAKGYADHPLAQVLLANALLFLVQNYGNGDSRIESMAEATLVAAMLNAGEAADISGIISKVFDGIKLPAILKEAE